MKNQNTIASDVQMESIFLVGPMGAGKTTIGKLLAKKLGYTFVDSDWYIEEQTGAEIAWIFEKEGEAGFRERETRAIDELTAKKNIILATGGGVVLSKDNREFLKNRGLVIYLNADVSVQIERTKKDKSRPLLRTAYPELVLSELYKTRHPLYQEVAAVEVASGRFFPKRMVEEVLYQIDISNLNKSFRGDL